MKKKSIKKRYWFALLVVVGVSLPFLIWIFIPSKSLEIILINKTFPVNETEASRNASELVYSKQRGLFWVLDHLKINNSATNKAHDVVNGDKDSARIVPDLIYISDAYGTGNSKIRASEETGVSGLTEEELSFIATSYAKGTTVIGEYNIAGEPTKPKVAKEIEQIFGVGFMGWAGKFFSDLSSEADVPGWIRSTYEQQYGKKWSLSGAGVVIAGNNRVIVLERETDFTEQSIQLFMTEKNAEVFHTDTINYYNWFEIVTPAKEESVLAWYDLNLTEEGEDKLEPFGFNGRFPAIVFNESDHKSSYYFAGDFTDYREQAKIKPFTGAAALYRIFSVNSEGDNSYFYWHFYVPFMSKVMKDLQPLNENITFHAEAELASNGTQAMSKVVNGHLAVYQDGSWKDMYVNGVNIGYTLPGEPAGTIPNNSMLYAQWLEQIGEMSANTIRVYALMPPGFYRALDIYNSNHPTDKLYLLQNISAGPRPSAENLTDSDYNAKYKQAIQDTIDAIHGKLAIKGNGDQGSRMYLNDVSGYILGFLVDPGLNPKSVALTDKLNPVSPYRGNFVSSMAGSTPTESWIASICDSIFQYEQSTYSMQHPTAVVSTPELDELKHNITNDASMKDTVSIDLDHLDLSSEVITGLFGAYDVYPDRIAFTTAAKEDATSSFEGYKKYLGELLKTQTKYPALISELGVSTVRNNERQQGEAIVSMLDIVKASGSMGALIYEWSDEWGTGGRNNLWHNRRDPAQNYGLLALESETPKEYSMTLHGEEPLESLAFTADESYFYVKARFSELPDFNKKNIMIYLDTVDRKNGEYMLAPDVNENWSGVEYNIQIQSPEQAEFLVIPTYNSSRGSYYTVVSTTGLFEKFEGSAHLYQLEGNTITVRIPWEQLNFADPSSHLVIDDKTFQGLADNNKLKPAVRQTDGIVTSLVIMDKGTNAVDYHFPESVTSLAYRTFTWNSWDKPAYSSRKKTSYEMIRDSFEGRKL